jgi:hypothetical protein
MWRDGRDGRDSRDSRNPRYPSQYPPSHYGGNDRDSGHRDSHNRLPPPEYRRDRNGAEPPPRSGSSYGRNERNRPPRDEPRSYERNGGGLYDNRGYDGRRDGGTFSPRDTPRRDEFRSREWDRERERDSYYGQGQSYGSPNVARPHSSSWNRYEGRESGGGPFSSGSGGASHRGARDGGSSWDRGRDRERERDRDREPEEWSNGGDRKRYRPASPKQMQSQMQIGSSPAAGGHHYPARRMEDDFESPRSMKRVKVEDHPYSQRAGSERGEHQREHYRENVQSMRVSDHSNSSDKKMKWQEKPQDMTAADLQQLSDAELKQYKTLLVTQMEEINNQLDNGEENSTHFQHRLERAIHRAKEQEKKEAQKETTAPQDGTIPPSRSNHSKLSLSERVYRENEEAARESGEGQKALETDFQRAVAQWQSKHAESGGAPTGWKRPSDVVLTAIQGVISWRKEWTTSRHAELTAARWQYTSLWLKQLIDSGNGAWWDDRTRTESLNHFAAAAFNRMEKTQRSAWIRSRVPYLTSLEAEIPPMLSASPYDKNARFPFHSRNGWVEDPVAAMSEQTAVWAPSEVHIFLDSYLKSPKNFRRIASLLPAKSVGDVVVYYYQNKKKHYLKELRESGARGGKRQLMELAAMEAARTHWATEERSKFVELYMKYGRDFRQIAHHIGSRDWSECSTFYQENKKRLRLDDLRVQYLERKTEND